MCETVIGRERGHVRSHKNMRNIRLKEKENMAASLHIGVHKKDTNVRLTQPSINKKKSLKELMLLPLPKQ